MKNNNEKILQLNLLVSKLLDTLCFQLTINKVDNNSLSLLQYVITNQHRILIWKKTNQINDSQFQQLYLSWLDSKLIPDILTTKQFQIYPKNELLTHPLIQSHFITINQVKHSLTQITKSLQTINQIYNLCYKQKKPNNLYQLQQTQKIFSYLDFNGYIHLTLSSIFYFTASILILDNINLPNNYQGFKIYMTNLRKQMSEISGMICLRNFKNYFLNLPSLKRNNYLENIFAIFSEIQLTLTQQNNHIPNILDQIILKWKNYPRFNSLDNKKKIFIYRRLFQQNQSIFYDDLANPEYFIAKYGQQFVKSNRIDNPLLKQLCTLLKETLNQHIDVFCKISQKINMKSTQRNTNLTMTTHRSKSPKTIYTEHPQKKLARLSTKQRTPTKHSKNKQYKTKTPTKSLYKQKNNHQIKRSPFGLSAQKIKLKNCQTFKDVTPAKSYRMVNHSSQENDLAPQSGMKVGVEKDSVYYKIPFFRNKRVQSYDIVMKRMKNK